MSGTRVYSLGVEGVTTVVTIHVLDLLTCVRSPQEHKGGVGTAVTGVYQSHYKGHSFRNTCSYIR